MSADVQSAIESLLKYRPSPLARYLLLTIAVALKDNIDDIFFDYALQFPNAASCFPVLRHQPQNRARRQTESRSAD